MKIGRFDASVGRRVSAYGSQNLTISRVAHVERETAIHCMFLEAGGKVGFHQTIQNQLFLVVAGAGWVRGETGAEIEISVGEAAFWHAGEWHGARTERGLTALVIEGPDVTALETRESS